VKAMNPKPQKWRRVYQQIVLTIVTELGGVWEIEGAGLRVPSGPGTPLAAIQLHADHIAGEPPSSPWQRICRLCEEPMKRLDDVWVCPKLHEEDADDDDDRSEPGDD
jgi:hypothetical protein